MRNYKHIIFICLISVTCFFLDLVTKITASSTLVEYERNEVIPNFFHLTLCYNTGGAWSIFSGNIAFLVIVSLIALCVVIYTMIKSKTLFYKYSCAIFIGGLIGNLYDRIVYGKVIDFLDFIIFGYDFPVFNIADCFICIGVGIMLVAMIWEERKYGRINVKD